MQSTACADLKLTYREKESSEKRFFFLRGGGGGGGSRLLANEKLIAVYLPVAYSQNLIFGKR